MLVVTPTAGQVPSVRSRRWSIALLGITSSIALTFVGAAAVPYYLSESYRALDYVGERGLLLVHISAGIVALSLGPLQLWLGLARTQPALHRALGTIYVATVGIGSLAALPLALRSVHGPIFASGMLGLTAESSVEGVAIATSAARGTRKMRSGGVRSPANARLANRFSGQRSSLL